MFREELGQKIRLYRRLNKFSLNELGQQICKSKSTVAKYEKGTISIDVETLVDITRALNISVASLLSEEEKPQLHETPLQGIFSQYRLYLYFFDGRIGKGRIVKSQLHLHKCRNHKGNAELFMGIQHHESNEECQIFYYGQYEINGLGINLLFRNQVNQNEQLNIIGLHPLINQEWIDVLISGISHHPIVPMASRGLLSTNWMQDHDPLLSRLKLSKEDMAFIKKTNMFPII